MLFTHCIIDAANSTHAPVYFGEARTKRRGHLVGDEQMLLSRSRRCLAPTCPVARLYSNYVVPIPCHRSHLMELMLRKTRTGSLPDPWCRPAVHPSPHHCAQTYIRDNFCGPSQSLQCRGCVAAVPPAPTVSFDSALGMEVVCC